MDTWVYNGGVWSFLGSTIIATAPHFTPAPAGFSPFGPPPTILGPIANNRAPAPAFAPPFTPVLYWTCPSPPVSPPHQPALVIMQGTPPPPPYAGHHEVTNFIHSVSEWSVDYLTPSHQFSSLALNTVGMHSAAA